MLLLTNILKKQNNDLDFPNVEVEDHGLPEHLIPNQEMVDRFKQNCKDEGVW